MALIARSEFYGRPCRTRDASTNTNAARWKEKEKSLITLSVFPWTIKNQNEMVPLLITYYLITGPKTKKKKRRGVKNGSASWFLLNGHALLLIDERTHDPKESWARLLWYPVDAPRSAGPDCRYIFGQTFTFRNKDASFYVPRLVGSLCNERRTRFSLWSRASACQMSKLCCPELATIVRAQQVTALRLLHCKQR